MTGPTEGLASASAIGPPDQVVLGLIDLTEPDPDLVEDIRSLAGCVFALTAGRYLLITSRNMLERDTDGFQHLPLLSQLTHRHQRVHIGLGIGMTAAHAESLAQRALTRCRTVGPFSAVLALGTGDDIVLAEENPAPAADGAMPLALVARRTGLSRGRLERLQALVEDAEEDGVTVSAVAGALEIDARSARRTIKRLERAGTAYPVGRMLTGTTGRPPTIYRIRLG